MHLAGKDGTPRSAINIRGASAVISLIPVKSEVVSMLAYTGPWHSQTARLSISTLILLIIVNHGTYIPRHSGVYVQPLFRLSDVIFLLQRISTTHSLRLGGFPQRRTLMGIRGA
jgi:hypothetical protein